MGFHFKVEGDSTNYGANLTDYKFPFPSVDVLPSRDGRNMGNAYCSNSQLYSMDALHKCRCMCANTIHSCLTFTSGRFLQWHN